MTMKKLLTMIAAVAVLGGVAAWAHGGNCPGDKAKAEAKPAASSCAAKCAAKGEAKAEAECPMSAALAKLTLTDEQKKQVESLKADCGKATSQSEARKMCAAGLEKILTAEQYKEWQAACDAGAKKCGADCAKACCKK
jgi:hypothetical protein